MKKRRSHVDGVLGITFDSKVLVGEKDVYKRQGDENRRRIYLF